MINHLKISAFSHPVNDSIISCLSHEIRQPARKPVNSVLHSVKELAFISLN